MTRFRARSTPLRASGSNASSRSSRARSDARPDSDYDAAGFLEEFESLGREAGRIAEIETDVLYDAGAVIDALPFPAGPAKGRAD
jgi:hypothetical protein